PTGLSGFFSSGSWPITAAAPQRIRTVFPILPFPLGEWEPVETSRLIYEPAWKRPAFSWTANDPSQMVYFAGAAWARPATMVQLSPSFRNSRFRQCQSAVPATPSGRAPDG